MELCRSIHHALCQAKVWEGLIAVADLEAVRFCASQRNIIIRITVRFCATSFYHHIGMKVAPNCGLLTSQYVDITSHVSLK
jgi:hypothetical protein